MPLVARDFHSKVRIARDFKILQYFSGGMEWNSLAEEVGEYQKVWMFETGVTKIAKANYLSLNGLTHTKPDTMIERAHTHTYIYIYKYHSLYHTVS